MNGEIVGQKPVRSNVSYLWAGRVLDGSVGREDLVIARSDVGSSFGDFGTAPVPGGAGRDDAGFGQHFGERLVGIGERFAGSVVRQIERSAVEYELLTVLRAHGTGRDDSVADFDLGAFGSGHGEQDGRHDGFRHRLVVAVDVGFPRFDVFDDGRDLECLAVFRSRIRVMLFRKGVLRVLGQVVDGDFRIEIPLVRRDVGGSGADDGERVAGTGVSSGLLFFRFQGHLELVHVRDARRVAGSKKGRAVRNEPDRGNDSEDRHDDEELDERKRVSAGSQRGGSDVHGVLN